MIGAILFYLQEVNPSMLDLVSNLTTTLDQDKEYDLYE